MRKKTDAGEAARQVSGGWAGWIRAKLRPAERAKPRLALRERIALGPRQSLALVEADGNRILVATGHEGAASFYLLEPSRPGRDGRRSGVAGRISW
jgi:hypothetical protein